MRPNYKHHLSPPPTPRNASEPFAYLAQERWNKVLAIAALAAVQTLFALGTVFVKWTLRSTKVNPIILLLYREISAAAILIMLSARLGESQARSPGPLGLGPASPRPFLAHHLLTSTKRASLAITLFQARR